MADISPNRVSSGVSGLDEVLHGGFVAGRNYLVRGSPGAGKTILGFHFLTAGGDDERSLSINVEESSADEGDTVSGEFQVTNANTSYLADNIRFLWCLDGRGELRKTIGVLKKRVSAFEHTLREFRITSDGVGVGDTLTGRSGSFQGPTDSPEDD